MSVSARMLLLSAALASVAPSAGLAQGKPAKPSNAQKMQEAAVTDIPHCNRKLGTVSIANGDDPYGWTQFNLAPPEKLLKVLVQKSGCFNLVDRGAGLNAAATERDIGGSLGLQRGSNVGKGQIKAADYVLVAEVQAANGNAQGSGAAAVPWTDLESSRRVMEPCHAFVDPTEADDRGIRLRLPAQVLE